MITPRFWIDQTDSTVDLTILIKYAKIKSIESEVQDNNFWFYLKPYHLHLTFPGQLQPTENAKIEYNPIKSELSVTLFKQTPGEHFPDLSLLSTLLQPKISSAPKLIVPELPESELEPDENLAKGYGFNHKESGFFLERAEEMFELFDVDPENTDLNERLEISTQQENTNWDLDRYFEDIDLDLEQKSSKKLLSEFLPTIEQRMSAMSLESLVKIGNKHLLLHKSLERPHFLLIAELVYCFCLELRALGELSCETGCNINKTSPGLSCLLEFNTVEEMLRKVNRRVLVYGVYRNLQVIEWAWEDTKELFTEGKEAVLRVLLRIKKCFDGSDPRYLLNRIFVDDLVIWVQKFEGFREFAEEVLAAGVPDVSVLGLDFSFK